MEDKTQIDNKSAIPQTGFELVALWRSVCDFVSPLNLTPPLLEDEVMVYSKQLLEQHPELKNYEKLLAVMINNVVWKQVISGIPFNRRVLLLPKCLRNSKVCKAEFDELGLLCEQCGACSISSITEIADSLGCHTIVSEGTTSVSVLLSSGQVECVIGVGCLDSFERSFPLAVREAVPSMAIPLFNCACIDSKVDEEFIEEVLSVKSEKEWDGWINIEDIRTEVQSWFTVDNIKTQLNVDDDTSTIAIEWLAEDGKRWRPLIMACVYNSLTNSGIADNKTIMKLALSIECFHKASLVHDDIEDYDSERYDKPTIHKKYDIPVGINIGDILTGFGYQLIAESGVDGATIAKLLSVASIGHRDLCIGQGEELLSRHNKKLLSKDDVLKIFRLKTSPAFEVALKFGAIVAEADDSVLATMHEYSEQLGIAYQIKDDLDDFKNDTIEQNFSVFEPSMVAAILATDYPKEIKEFNQRLALGDSTAVNDLKQWDALNNAIVQSNDMLEVYRMKSLKALRDIKITNLKILLYRLVNKIVTTV